MNSCLFTVTNVSLIDKLKSKGIKNFVYPLSFFCVGIPKTFTIDEITEDNAFIYVNRILDTKSIDELNSLLHHLPSNIKGIIFDDLGVIEITKDLNIQKILYLSHFNCNYKSINAYFEYVDDVIVSTDVTEEEIDEIIKYADKDISLFAFGLVSSMYSRRLLNSNFAKHYNLDIEAIKDLSIGKEKFLSVENEYGTVIYHYPYFNGTRLLSKKAHYFFYFPILLSNDEILDVLDNNFTNISFDEGFLDIKTIYKVKKEAK